MAGGGIIPPVLYAFVQFDEIAMPAIVLVGFVLLQVAISNFVYPILQGRQKSLSPLAIIVAMTFWIWVWGIAGGADRGAADRRRGDRLQPFRPNALDREPVVSLKSVSPHLR